MIKIGIDPSGTGTTAIVVYEDNKIVHKQEFFNKDWKEHYELIDEYMDEYYYSEDYYFVNENGDFITQIWNIENCLYTNANASKDRDDLLQLIGAYKIVYQFLNWVSPKHTKSVVKNIENLSKYNNGCIQEFSKDENLTYEYGKGWKYNNEKISNHLRDAIIIANYES